MILLIGLVGIFTLLSLGLLFLVDVAVDSISPEDEAVLHKQLDLDWDDELKQHPALNAQLQKRLDMLLPCTPLTYPIRIHVEDSEMINAMAFPGGHIMILSPLLNAVKSENGLAFVLGHELGHFIHRDHLRSLGGRIVLVSLSSFFTGPDSFLSRVIAPTSQLGMATYSQRQESNADEEALKILDCAYGHVGGATEFFAELESNRSLMDFGLGHYFADHPTLEARISRLEQEIQENGYKIGRVRPLNLTTTSFE